MLAGGGWARRVRRAAGGRGPRNIIHGEASVLQIAANWTIWKCIQMLIRFGFRQNILYICIAKRREPVSKGFSPLFSWEKDQNNHCFTT